MHYKKVVIWGPNPFANRLLAQHIHMISDVLPSCCCSEHERNSLLLDETCLVFCDCNKTNPVLYCRSLHRPGQELHAVPRIALMNVQPQQDLLDEIKAFGIDGVFYATDPFELIDKGIRKILSGEHWLGKNLLIRSLQSVREEVRRDNGSILHTDLTLREQEILKLIVAGCDNQTIADKLFISPNTVKTHVSNIYKKIDATNRVQAIIWATENTLHLPQFQVLHENEQETQNAWGSAPVRRV